MKFLSATRLTDQYTRSWISVYQNEEWRQGSRALAITTSIKCARPVGCTNIEKEI